MKTVANILAAKEPVVYAVTPDTSVFEALEVMAKHNIGAVLVTDSGKLSGIMSERDYARKIILVGKASKDTKVSEIMSAKVTTVAPETSINECMEMMTAGKFRHLPVMDDGELVGMVSIGDVVEAVIGGLGFMVDQLESYIRGT
jgi:CBS domain-containing protein